MEDYCVQKFIEFVKRGKIGMLINIENKYRYWNIIKTFRSFFGDYIKINYINIEIDKSKYVDIDKCDVFMVNKRKNRDIKKGEIPLLPEKEISDKYILWELSGECELLLNEERYSFFIFVDNVLETDKDTLVVKGTVMKF